MSRNSGPITGPRGLECVCLMLTIAIPADPLEPDALPLSFETWTVGPDRATALRDWKRQNRKLAADLAAVRQVSPMVRTVSEAELERRAVTNTGRLKYA